MFLLLLLLPSSWAAHIAGRIQWNDVCNSTSAFAPSNVLLDNGVFSAGILRDGSFEIPDVPTGVYVLRVLSHDYLFDQFRIDVHSNDIPEVRPYIPGTPLNPPSTVQLPYPISLGAKQKFNYFAPPASFNLLGMLASPMILLMLGGAGMMLAMPWMMKNMDPESLEELKEQQAKMARMQSAVTSGDLKSGFSALLGGDEGVVASPTAPKSKSKSNKHRKR